jgi:hypothetical protein
VFNDNIFQEQERKISFVKAVPISTLNGRSRSLYLSLMKWAQTTTTRKAERKEAAKRRRGGSFKDFRCAYCVVSIHHSPLMSDEFRHYTRTYARAAHSHLDVTTDIVQSSTLVMKSGTMKVTRSPSTLESLFGFYKKTLSLVLRLFHFANICAT